ncbi:5-formyltetrahydrofolate cyclo-ligase [uncultured Alistipes sp.]|uniref:5-formyltetrahydrofolate cyclo-ligase n=1 Tax=uncultured Alistipes sp. TaxID=538949 RepID=UPI00272B2BFC|nr:5-formyltetrahydrofolate cyclo-ligase [uncultured Alistipes sp.]
MTKQEIRVAMKRANRALSDTERRAASERIWAQVAASAEFAAARCVALFCSLADEPDTAAVLAAWSREKRIVVPRVEGETMQFYDYDPATMACGAFGIAEPGPRAVRCRPEEIDLLVVPGVAFARSGLRLGRGKGYYDRYLAQPGMRACRIGVCYAHQLVADLPAEPHDAPMDRVVDDKDSFGTMRARGGGK